MVAAEPVAPILMYAPEEAAVEDPRFEWQVSVIGIPALSHSKVSGSRLTLRLPG